MFCFILQSLNLDNHRRSAACYHQHGAAVAHGFVIQVDAYDGVAAQGCGTVGHLSEGSILGLAEGAFVRTASSTYHITDTGKEILHKVGTNDGFAGHYATIFTDRVAFYGWSCTQNHNLSFLFYVIINVIYSLDEKSREKVAAKQKIFS
jgi:hypothetical protein